MSNWVMAIWECDRCGRRDEGKEVGWQPETWVALIRVCPPKASTEGEIRRTLCSTCHYEWMEWYQNVPKDEPAEAPEEVRCDECDWLLPNHRVGCAQIPGVRINDGLDGAGTLGS